MDSLEEISVEELKAVLEEVEEKRPTKRLMVAILYKQGLKVPEISDIYGFSETTIYRWFKWLRNEPIEEAIYDKKRNGRPTKLTEKQQKELNKTLQKPPTETGYDEQAWNPKLVQNHIKENHDINYSRSHIYKIMKKHGLTCKTPRPKPGSADEDERKGFKKWFKKTEETEK